MLIDDCSAPPPPADEDAATRRRKRILKAFEAPDVHICTQVLSEPLPPKRKSRAAMPPTDAFPEAKIAPRGFALRKIETAEDIKGALNDVLAAVAAGELTASEGLAIAKIVDAQRNAIELIEYGGRLDLLERGPTMG